VTRSIPPSRERLERSIVEAQGHLDAVAAVGNSTDPASLRGYEFGAGWHLATAVACAMLGVNEVVTVDQVRLVDDEFVRRSIDTIAPQVAQTDRVTTAVASRTTEAALRCLGVRYEAPVDAAATGLPSGSFGFAMSTNTMEHIPEPEITPLFTECRRLLAPGGVLSLMIDYKDHYALFDRACGPHNFLRYSERAWRKWSPKMHYQNRLRHSDHLRLVEEAGFEVVAVTTVDPTDDDRRWLDSHEIDPSFAHYGVDDLLTRSAHIVATRPA
jgi:SAM-dependent methyltransferase